MFRDVGITPIGIETYANSRRLEKSLRLQNADLLTEYNLVEAGLARPKVKASDFHGKAAYLERRERAHQPAMLCKPTLPDNTHQDGVASFPIADYPVVNPTPGAVMRYPPGRAPTPHTRAHSPTLGTTKPNKH